MDIKAYKSQMGLEFYGDLNKFLKIAIIGGWKPKGDLKKIILDEVYSSPKSESYIDKNECFTIADSLEKVLNTNDEEIFLKLEKRNLFIKDEFIEKVISFFRFGDGGAYLEVREINNLVRCFPYDAGYDPKLEKVWNE